MDVSLLPDLDGYQTLGLLPLSLLPIARDWWCKLRRPAPWPDHLDEWLEMCHAAGQTKSTAILLKYGPGDWNALHRDLYGDLVFPLQVVVNLSEPVSDSRLASCFTTPLDGPRHHRRAPRDTDLRSAGLSVGAARDRQGRLRQAPGVLRRRSRRRRGRLPAVRPLHARAVPEVES